MQDTRWHSVDKMGYSENDIFLEIEGRGSKQHTRTSDFKKVMVFALDYPILLGGVGARTLVEFAFG